MNFVSPPIDPLRQQKMWNSTDRSLSQVRRIETLIAGQAERHPDRTVSVSDRDEMSFGTLERRADILAAHLKSAGVARGDFVLIDVPRDHSMLVAWLAVLKTGAAFMPLDPEDSGHKCARLARMPEVRFSLSGPVPRPEFMGLGLRQLCFSLDGLDSQETPENAVQRDDDPDAPAYAIATSGSTGDPKCVVVSHRAIFNLFDWIGRQFKLRPRDRGIWVSPASFDLSVFDLLGLAALGASVQLVSSDARRDPAKVAALLKSEPITFWNSAPALLSTVVPFLGGSGEELSSLRLAFLSGDFIPLALPRDLHAIAPNAEFVALGGATEAAIWSNYFRVGAISPEWRSIPYGRPIQNARYYILAPDGSPLPANEPGELFIGGACLAEGYLGDDAQTRKTFVPDPFAEGTSERLYRTGDQAMFWPDGTIEILGRLDRQIKVSGYRVHLGEIEAAMRSVGLERSIAVALPARERSHRIAAAIHESAPAEEVWRPGLEALLPRHAMPEPVLRLADWPHTANGKVDRKAIEARVASALETRPNGRAQPTEDDGFLGLLMRAAAEILDPSVAIDPDAPLGSLGFGSLEFALLVGRLHEDHGLTLNPVLFYEAGNLRASAEMIAKISGKAQNKREPEPAPVSLLRVPQVFISGISFRLPGADGWDDLWQVLCSGQSQTTSLPDLPKRWLEPGGKAGFLTNIDRFDAGFFRITPREAALMDPRQKLLLEAAWAAIEDAGCDPSQLSGTRVGVFVGATGDDYSRLANRDQANITAHTMTGISPSLLANRLSFAFDFRGPSECIDTACSSSLVALDRARSAMERGECTSALVCGVSLMLDGATDQALSHLGMLSPSGRCRTFDAAADGYARGEGIVALYLSADEGVSAGHARVLASAVNHNGRSVSLTAPTPKGQSAVIAETLARSGIDPDTIGMIEMHGTGTALGDPIEVRGLIDGFGARARLTEGGARCGLGSIKASVGHLEAAAGLAGVVRAILCAREGRIPAVPGLDRVNPNIDLASTRFFIPTQSEPWPVPEEMSPNRRTAISSFGFGGTNAHVILECPPREARLDSPEPSPLPVLLPVSARDPESLGAYALTLAGFCTRLAASGIGEGILRRMAKTLQHGRASFEHRAVVAARTLSEAEALFSALATAAGSGTVLSEPGTNIPSGALSWVKGGDADWPRNDDAPLSMPTYPFRRDSHWTNWRKQPRDEEKTVALEPFHSLIEQHVINGSAAVPAAVFLTLLFKSAAELSDEPVQSLEAIRLRGNLQGPGLPKTLCLRVAPTSAGWQLSLAAPDRDETLCSAVLKRGAEAADSVPGPAVRRSTETFTRAHIYARFRDIGAELGPRLRVLDAAAFDGEVCRTRLPDRPDGAMGQTEQIEAAIQTALLLSLSQGEESGVPVTIERLTLHADGLVPDHAISWRPASSGSVDIVLAAGAAPVLSMRGLRGIPGRKSQVVSLFERAFGQDLPVRHSAAAQEIYLSGGEGGLTRGLGLAAWPATAPTARARSVVFDASDGWREAVARISALAPSLSKEPDLNVRLLCPVHSPEGSPELLGLGAFCRSLRKETPGLEVSAVGILSRDPAAFSSAELGRLCTAEDLPATVIFDPARDRFIADRLMPLEPVSSTPRTGGVYIVTGGVRGIAAVIARHLVNNRKAQVVICGRSPEGPEVEVALSRLCAGSPDLSYCQADVSDRSSVARLVQVAHERYGPVTGIVHAAGILADGLAADMGPDDYASVLAPKLDGARHLDWATRDEPLAQFVVFSSLVTSTGAAGQCAYGFANGMLEGFAMERQRRHGRGERPGKTTCIAWGPWFTGMRLPAGGLARLRDKTGLEAFGSAAGIEAFECALGQKSSSLVAVNGAPSRLRQWLSAGRPGVEHTQFGNSSMDKNAIKSLCLQALAEECLIAVEDIDPTLPFEDYGVDSAIILGVTEHLEAELGPLPATLFFESRTVETLVQKLFGLLGTDQKANAPAQSREPRAPETGSRSEPPETAAPASVAARASAEANEPIAIIGMDGQFPQAETLDALWQVLSEGRDCISEVPADRWDYALVAPEHKNFGPESGFRWGGFLRAPYAFDPEFFRMSRREAEMIDPQERLFLLSVYRCLAQAGYPGGALAETPVGIYAGAMWSQYQLWGLESGLAASSFASIANRASFTFGFTGPSIGLDTMCSSSLTAVHLACSALRRHEISAAIAGGVNVNAHPNKHFFLCNRHFASPDGRCRAFGAEGDGYVASEGVGTIMLKRQSQAEADGDTILGLILGSAINHDGRTSGYTVPSVAAQTEVVRSALADAGVDPSTVSYVEAHGTGTALGDPIEVKALAYAFELDGEEGNSCTIGSIKSNIGHAESAAGIAGILKVLLQMQHQQITPSIHATPANPNIDFASTPFEVTTRAMDWRGGPKTPLRAGVSSFGASGANAHIVLQQAPLPEPVAAPATSEHIIPLSATSEARLVAVIRQLRETLAGERATEPTAPRATVGDGVLDQILSVIAATLGVDRTFVSPQDDFETYGMDEAEENALRGEIARILEMPATALAVLRGTPAALVEEAKSAAASPAEILLADIAYTLQTGREPLPHRLAIVAKTVPELVNTLESVLAEGEDAPNVRRGATNRLLKPRQMSARETALTDKLLAEGQTLRVAELWCQGAVDLAAMARRVPRRRVPLPAFPFELVDCRLPDPTLIVKGRASPLSPLVDQVDLARSLGAGLVFTKALSKRSAPVNGDGCLDLAGALAIVASTAVMVDGQDVELSDIVWSGDRALRHDTDSLLISVTPEEAGKRIGLRLKDQSDALSVLMKSPSQDNSVDWSEVVRNAAPPLDAGPAQSAGGGTAAERGQEVRVTRLRLEEGASPEGSRRAFEMMLQMGPSEGVTGELGIDRIVLRGPVDGRDQLVCMERGGKQTMAVVGTDGRVRIEMTLSPGKPTDRAVADPEGREAQARSTPDIPVREATKEPDARPSPPENAEAARVAVSQLQSEPGLGSGVPFPQALSWIEADYDQQSGGSEGKVAILATPSADLMCRNVSRIMGERVALTLMLQEECDIEGIRSALDAAPDLAEVIVLVSGGAPVLEEDGLDMALEQSAMPILALARYLAKSPNPPAIRLLTQGAFRLGEETIYPTSRVATTLLASLSREHPKVQMSSIDLESCLLARDLAAETEAALPIVTGVLAQRGGMHALRGGRLYRRCLKPLSAGESAEEVFIPGQACLIVGGSGVVGRKLTEILTRDYGATVYWIGRRSSPEGLEDAVAQAAGSGGRLSYHSVDVSDAFAVRDFIEEIEGDGERLRSVIHCGMGFQVGRLAELDKDALYDGLRAKVHGSVALIKSLETTDVEHLVFMSSGESLTGNPGWGAYAAACAFQDALAEEYDPASGLHRVVSVNWGYWQGSGRGDPETLRAKGVFPIEAGAGFEALKHILGSGAARAAAIDADPAVIARMHLPMRGFDTVETVPSKHDPDTGTREDQQTRAADDEIRGRSEQADAELPAKAAAGGGNCQAQVTHLLAEALRIDPDTIDPDMDIVEYGVDSILVLDFISLLEERFGEVPADEIIEFQTIRSIADYLEQFLASQDAGKEPKPAEAPAASDTGPRGKIVNVVQADSEPAVAEGSHVKTDLDTFPLVITAKRAHAEKALLDYPDVFDSQPQKRADILALRPSADDFQIRMVPLADGTALEVVTCGSGRPILMLPGIGLTAPIFHHQFRTLCQNHKLIVIHAPGHGRSDAPRVPKVDALVETLEETLDALQLSAPVDVVASCFGTLVAMRLALVAPRFVNSLCLCGAFSENSDFSPIPTDGLSAKQLAEITLAAANSLASDFDSIKEAGMNAGRQQAIADGRAVLLASQKAKPSVGMRYLNDVLSLRPTQWLGDIKAPTSLVSGTLDSIVGPNAAHDIAHHLANGRVVEIEGAGHYPFLSHPDLFENALFSHLQDVTSHAA